MLKLLVVLAALASTALANADCNALMEELGACYLTTGDHDLTVFENMFEDLSACGLGQTAAESKARYYAVRDHCKTVKTAEPADDDCQACSATFDTRACRSIFLDLDPDLIQNAHSDCETHCLAAVLAHCPPATFWMDCKDCARGFKADGGCDPDITQGDIDEMLLTNYACGDRCNVVAKCDEEDEEDQDPVDDGTPVPAKESDSSDGEETQVGTSGPCSGVQEVADESNGAANTAVGVASALLAGGSVVGATAKGANLVGVAGSALGVGMKMSPIGLGISTGMSMASVLLPMLFSQPNPNDAKIQANKDAINALATCVNQELASIRADMQVLENSIQSLYTSLNVAHNAEIMYLEDEMHREKTNLNACWIHMNDDGSKSGCEWNDFKEGTKYTEFHRISGQVKALLTNTRSVYGGGYTADQKKKLSQAVGGLIILYAQYYEDYVASLTPRGVLLIEEAGDQNVNMIVTKWTEIYNELNAAYNAAPSEYSGSCYWFCRHSSYNQIGDGRCWWRSYCNTAACEYDGGDCLDQDSNISVTSQVRMNLRNARALAQRMKEAAQGLKTRYLNGKPTSKVQKSFPGTGRYTLMTCTPTGYRQYQNTYSTRGTLSKEIQDAVGLPLLSACLAYITPSGYTRTSYAVIGDDSGSSTTYLGGTFTLGACAAECNARSSCGGFELGMKMAPYEKDCDDYYNGGCWRRGRAEISESRRRMCRRRQEADLERRELYGGSQCRTLDPNGNGFIEYPYRGTAPGRCILHHWYGQKPSYFRNYASNYGKRLYTRNSKPNGAALAIEAGVEAEVGAKAISVEAEAPVCNTATTYGMWAAGIIATVALTRAYYKSSKDASMHALLVENEL